MNFRLVLLPLIAVLLVAPIRTHSTQWATAQTLSDSQQQISSVLNEWLIDWKARDAEAISGLYAQDAILYPAINRRVEAQGTGGDFNGPYAIRDYFKQLFERLADPKTGEILNPPGSAEQSGGLAFDDGFVQYLVKGKCKPSDPGDGPCVLKTYNLTVLKRSSDGKWLIVRQSFTQVGLGSTIYTPHSSQ
jgi:ketosteroid isomerase-like protein